MSDKILTYYLLHFIYWPITLIAAIIIENGDMNTIGLGMFLFTILYVLNYLFNAVITLITLKLIEDSKYNIVGYLMPAAIALALHYPIHGLINFLDVIGPNLYWMLIGNAVIMNLIIFWIIPKDRKEASA